MKARISKSQTFNESGIILSVGMIVKNEEKYLDKCLTALSPLLDAVPSELVIVDTGSTDRTVEIAKSYTDKVYNFEWVRDFAAARNFGLEKCTGDWFMFLDADEIFDETPGELIGFFADKAARSKYNSATYMVRNYHDPEGDEWSTATLARVVKRLPGVRFHGAIHEHILPFPQPTQSIKTFVHHWGYAFENEEQAAVKRKRNLAPLYDELKKTPNNIRIRSHILADLRGEELAEFLSETLTITRKQLNNPYTQGIFALNITNYFALEKYESALGSIDEFSKSFGKKPKTIRWLDIYAAKALSLLRLEQLEEAIEAFDEYFKLYDLYLANKLAAETGNLVITFCEQAKHDEMRADYNNLLVKTGRKKLTLLGGTDISISVETSAAAVKPEDDGLSDEEWLPLFEALDNNTDITTLTENLDGERIRKYMARIADISFNLPRAVLDYNQSILEKNLQFGVILYETASKQAGRLPWHERAEFYENFVKYASLYAAGNYNPTDELCRFGHYAGKGEFEAALNAVQSEHLKWAAEFLIEDSKEEQT
ncbi:MAG: glycosyltransferase family 2 protein [Oscillospiraceae bacterium]|jgi:glycosyltransferase involved in cell wall biosynthesis|nr:glycosyltransferase family 2 protein [Oscillospiraceae bacterium]